MRGVLVTGTDTGVGKTVVAAALAAALHERGAAVRTFKPAMSGADLLRDPDWPADHELLATAVGLTADEVTPLTFGPAYSPHLAAELSAITIEPRRLIGAARAAAAQTDVLVVEGIGGLLVPITYEFSMRDFARELGLPLVIVARPSLGTINHTLLTIEAARAAELGVAAVVLNPWPPQPSELERSNRETIERLSGLPVLTFPEIARPDQALLVAAGELLLEASVDIASMLDASD